MSVIDTITKKLLREDMLIGTTLSHFHAVEEAQKLLMIAQKENPIVSFGRKAEGHIAYGHAISPASLEHARIRMSPEDTAPVYRYFKRISACDGLKIKIGQGHGLSASAWGEVDATGENFLRKNGKYELRICYPGYPPAASLAQSKSMLTSFGGEFLQAREVGKFLDETVIAAKAKGFSSIDKVINTSWSMGAANALASKLYFQLENIPANAILGDAWRSSAALFDIAHSPEILLPLFNGSHAQKVQHTGRELMHKLAEDVISVYPAIQNQEGNWMRTSVTAPGPVQIAVPVLGKMQRFPLADKLGVMPFGKPVGQVFHLDAQDMKVIEPLPFLGDTHKRTNIINHLAAHGEDLLHEMPQVAAAKGAGHGIV